MNDFSNQSAHKKSDVEILSKLSAWKNPVKKNPVDKNVFCLWGKKLLRAVGFL